MAFPPQFLERIRSHFMLSELIGKRVKLTRRGREYTGLCPFHNEKSPSFTVNNEKAFFHCFGCAAHGDAIEFVKRYEHLEWREAVEKLAREAGIPIPDFRPEEREKFEQQKSLLDVMEAAAAYFQRELAAPANASARDYVKTRGLAPETQAQFRIGYAPEARDGIKKHLLKEGFTEAQLIEAGLLIKPDDGATYDRFRSRLIIPIRGITGKTIAFGGRLLSAGAGTHAPKYLNSPETPLFKKGEVLFNLDKAGAKARELGEISIVEGYMDVIAMVQAGIPNTVATLGTAVTEPHLRKLWQYAPEPTLCLDGDAAGKRAMLRAAELVLPLLKPGMSLRFALLPAGEDPDSLVRAQGAAALKAILSGARGLAETLWREEEAKGGKSAEARAALEHRLMEATMRIQDATVRAHYRAYFKREVWEQRGKKEKKPARSSQVETLQDDMRLKTARQLLKLVLLQPALLNEGSVEEHLATMDCISEPLTLLRDALLALSAEDGLMEKLNEQGFAVLVGTLLQDASITLPRLVAEDLPEARRCWQALISQGEIAALEAEYRDIEQRLHAGLDEETFSHFMEIQRQLKELNQKRRFAAPDVVED